MDKEKIDVYHVAALAKLKLSCDEIRQFETDMQQFAEFAKCLGQFSPDSIDDSCRISIDVCQFREDNILTADTDVLSNAKSVHDGYVTAPVTVDTTAESEAER